MLLEGTARVKKLLLSDDDRSMKQTEVREQQEGAWLSQTGAALQRGIKFIHLCWDNITCNVYEFREQLEIIRESKLKKIFCFE